MVKKHIVGPLAGGLFITMAVLAAFDYAAASFWVSLAVGILIVLTTIVWPIRDSWSKKRSLKRPIHGSYTTSGELKSSVDSQEIRLTLEMRTVVTIPEIRLLFEGEGILPTIKRLSDWNIGGRPWNLSRPNPTKDGRWVWTYLEPWRRAKGQKINIGLEISAPQPFEGTLQIETTIEELAEGHITVSLPIQVHETPEEQSEKDSNER